MRTTLHVLLLVCCAACATTPQVPTEADQVLPPLDFTITGQIDQGAVSVDALTEASGLAASPTQGVLWAHNDSPDRGTDTRLFALLPDGTYQATLTLDGAVNRDWEDLAAGPGPVPGQSYLYVGDIGDNNARYDEVVIYRLEEPDLSTGTELTVTQFDRLVYTYPDGARDAEALLLDPLTRDLYIVTKREDSVRVYHAPFPQPTAVPGVLTYVATLPLTMATAGDISADGRGILVKSYATILGWPRPTGRPLAAAFEAQPIVIPYTCEPQGEAIAFAAEGSGFYTLSEEPTRDFGCGEGEAHLFFFPFANP